jgi:hypothetical protein
MRASGRVPCAPVRRKCGRDAAGRAGRDAGGIVAHARAGSGGAGMAWGTAARACAASRRPALARAPRLARAERRGPRTRTWARPREPARPCGDWAAPHSGGRGGVGRPGLARPRTARGRGRGPAHAAAGKQAAPQEGRAGRPVTCDSPPDAVRLGTLGAARVGPTATAAIAPNRDGGTALNTSLTSRPHFRGRCTPSSGSRPGRTRRRRRPQPAQARGPARPFD